MGSTRRDRSTRTSNGTVLTGTNFPLVPGDDCPQITQTTRTHTHRSTA
jgi:hypothetical protein